VTSTGCWARIAVTVAVLEAGLEDLEGRRRGAARDLLGREGGADVDVVDVATGQRVTHAAADGRAHRQRGENGGGGGIGQKAGGGDAGVGGIRRRIGHRRGSVWPCWTAPGAEGGGDIGRAAVEAARQAEPDGAESIRPTPRSRAMTTPEEGSPLFGAKRRQTR
jgi:hypothetical protein